MPPAKSESVAAVLKVFGVLEALAEHRTVGLAELSQRVMTSKSTTHRLLQTMLELGYVEQEGETEKYGLTPKIFTLSAKVLNRHADLIRIADKVMATLARALGEAVHLGIMDEPTRTVVYVHKFDSAYNLSLQSPVGRRSPLNSTSLGKALLAWRDEDYLRDTLPRLSYVKSAPNTITDPEVLAAQLKTARARGYTEESEESEAGVRCMAVPVFDHEGKTVAAISLSFPLARYDEKRRDEYGSLLLETGRQASEGMGYQGSYPL